MMARLLRAAIFIACFLSAGSAFAAGGTCPSGANYITPSTGAAVTLSSLGVTSCYYISASGSDTNSGTTESSPWLHSPGMRNCANNCATLTPTAGTGIIFRGGDTWHFGNSSLSPYAGVVANCDFNATASAGLCFGNGNFHGTSTNPIYIGVDQTWFSGGSWARPIFNGDNPLTPNRGVFADSVASCPYQFGAQNKIVSFEGATYMILDSLEMTGLCSKSNGGASDLYIEQANGNNTPHNTYVRLYLHGWTHLPFTGGFLDNIILFGGDNTGGYQDAHLYNVVDGSDSDPGGIQFVTYGGAYNYAYNVFRYAANFVPDPVHIVHDNLFEFWYGEGDEQHHPNLFEENCCGTTGANNAVYNNVFRNVCVNGATNTCPVGSVGTWLEPAVGFTTYWFNNVEYNTGASINGNYFIVGQNANSGNQGAIRSFNNTWDNTTNKEIMDCDGSGFAEPFTFANNHYITDNGSPYASFCASSGQGTFVTELLQSHATANGQGYTASETYAYSSTSSSGSTVGKGTNETSTYCSALSGSSDPLLQAAGRACQSDTTYACAYNLTNHTVSCPARTPVARPTSTAWDKGAYQYSSTQASGPNPPTNLAVTVQ